MYIADLVRHLPMCYLVGVWEIIEERPFAETQMSELSIDFLKLKPKKLREIELYTKKKLSTIYKSRERKLEKIQKRKQLNKEEQKNENENEEAKN